LGQGTYLQSWEGNGYNDYNGFTLFARKVFVPGYWEDSGYKNYDGKAIYKTRFKLPKKLVNQELFLVLGFIDDTELVYLNDKKIGSVTSLNETEESNLPNHEIFRGYAIPNKLLKNKGYNSISIIIYDKGGWWRNLCWTYWNCNQRKL